MQQRKSSDALMIDVSRWQGSIDWSKVAADKVSAGWAKATDGATGRDPTFPANYANIKKAGLARGAYAFAHPGTSSAVDEANALVDVVLANGGFDLDPMLDLEVTEGKSPQQLADFILEWESRIKARTGRELILYTYAAFIQENLAPVASRINHLRLWLADYANTVPSVPGWDHWTILQYSESGSLPGIQGHVDLDAFDGTSAELRAELTTGAAQNTTTGVTTMTTDQIRQLQTNLRAVLGLPVSGPNEFKVDGVLGPKTVAAIKSFQYLNKLKTDGIAGPITISTLNKSVAKLQPVTKPAAPEVKAPATPAPAEKAAPAPADPAVSQMAKVVQAAQLIQQGLDVLKTL